jgi:hypothetical protein
MEKGRCHVKWNRSFTRKWPYHAKKEEELNYFHFSAASTKMPANIQGKGGGGRGSLNVVVILEI